MTAFGFLHREPSRTIVRIDALRAVERNWDSYDGEVVAESARKQCRDFVSQLERIVGPRLPEPFVGPTSDGGVVIVWRERNRPKVEVFFSNLGGRYLVTKQHEVIEKGPTSDAEVFAREVIKRYIVH
jgi:hypothetical protein